MDIKTALDNNSFMLTEAAIVETLRRSPGVDLHPLLVNALFVYDGAGNKALSGLYRDFITIARNAGVPVTICAPTWRANKERVAAARIGKDVNGDAVRFLKRLRDEWGTWAENIFVGSIIGCKNDCYKPEEGLATAEAKSFHQWQIDRLSRADADFIMAVTLPALPEAMGIALAMAETGTPYIISFVINREGRILDGNSLDDAFRAIDAACSRPPLGYMINCAHPSFLRAREQPESVFSRLVGCQGNASSLDHFELDGAGFLQTDDVSDWGDRMIELNRSYGVKILGGCCGTSCEHLEYIVRRLAGNRDDEADNHSPE
jgi:S-methylmethionine-dependent homocysteine/selenocysteine methylase